MPSPNSYIADATFAATNRNWTRLTLTYDADQAPWIPGQTGDYTFTYNVGTSAAGPFALAATTGATECVPGAGNPRTPGGLTSTVQGIGAPPGQPGSLAVGTAHWVEVVVLHLGVEVDRWVVGPVTTSAYGAPLPQTSNITTTSADARLLSSGGINLVSPCDVDQVTWELATAPGGPYTVTGPDDVDGLSPGPHAFTGLTPNTTYYWRATLRDEAGAVYYTSPEQTFTTLEDVVTTPPFQPQPCDAGAGAGGADVENLVLCDLDAEGNLLGTALAIYEYDETGSPVGAPTFVNPATGAAYVPQGTLQVCPDAACLPPMQFCQTSTTTGPVEHPGRQYDVTLPINPGFAVESMQVDQVTNAANIVWDVADPDGEQFRQDLTAFMEGRLPAAATVTITNPNAGVPQVCGAAAPMQVHIECIRLDQSPPDLIELVYNGGQDMVQNPAYNEFPALNPPVAQGDYGFHLLKRQDDPAGGGFPRALCTDTANRGWETNDAGSSFEIWGRNIVQGEDVTPTPRGTPVQEITSDGPPAGGINTIWQTFTAPASGNFIIRVVHGARDPGEVHRITLDNGDTDDAQNGDLIDDVSNPPSVTESGGPNPWTQFERTIPLTGGSTYTLALSTTETNPDGNARGGLFTDMRAYIDRPGLRATAATDDDTCVVTTEETTTNTLCSFWQPQCVGGAVAGWQKVDTGETLTNAEFWAQTPTPQCCGTDGGAGEGEASATLSNMAVSDVVCAVIGGIPRNVIRQVVLDPSGGTLSTTFLGADGGPVQPASWTPGPCSSERFVQDVVLCDQGAANQPFLRKYIQSLSDTGIGQVNSFRDFVLDGGQTYTPVGPVGVCGGADADRETVCWTQTSTGDTVHTGTIRHDDSLPAPGWILFDQNQTPVLPTEPGLTFISCADAMDPVATTGLCLADGTPIAVVVRRNSVTGTVSQDGWINLTTGAFTAGAPPVGVVACGSSQSIQVSGTFCSVDDTTGDVLALILIEYTYAADGSIESVRLVDATTGTTYVVPAGATVTTCPTGTAQPEQDLEVLCDVNAGVSTPFIRDYRRDENGTITATSDYTLAGAAYATTGTVSRCGSSDCETQQLCDVQEDVAAVLPSTGVPTEQWQDLPNGVRWMRRGNDGATPGGWYLAGTTLPERFDFDRPVNVVYSVRFTDSTAAPLRIPAGWYLDTINTGQHFWDPATRIIAPTASASLSGVSSFRIDAPTTQLMIAPVTTVAPPVGVNSQYGQITVTADVVTPFLRTLCRDVNGTVTVSDTTLDGTTPYTVLGTTERCPAGESSQAGATLDSETVVLCDSAATPNRFLRTYIYNETGGVSGFTDTTLAGDAFVPTGAVGVCATTVQTDTDFVEEILCDANGTSFIRLFRFNSTTGALISTTNTTLAGAAFAPVGAVGLCADCCPVPIGEGCTSVGSGRYTAIRAANGTVTLIDSVSGAAVAAGNIVACPTDDVVRTLTAQARVLTNATPWTPGADVTGTLTSLTVTGTGGLWDLVDANGTALTGLPAGLSLTWEAEDDNQIVPPQSVTPQAGATVVANWTLRA